MEWIYRPNSSAKVQISRRSSCPAIPRTSSPNREFSRRTYTSLGSRSPLTNSPPRCGRSWMDRIWTDRIRGAVSYTHLRAHETKANLVCRLLLEKKKKTKKNKKIEHKKTTTKKNKKKKKKTKS